MRRQLKLSHLVIGCVLILTACSQRASVGMPTPDPTAQALAAINATAAAASAGPTAVPTPLPAPTTAPAPAPTAAPTEAAAPSAAPTAAAPTAVPPTAAPPPATAAPAATPDSGGASGGSTGITCGQQIIHIVKPGENLFRIALHYQTTTYAIARRNGITNIRLIRPGQRLRILTCARGSASPASARGGTYTVRPGDTLFRIALRYGTSVKRLMTANGFYSSLIVPGQVVIIP